MDIVIVPGVSPGRDVKQVWSRGFERTKNVTKIHGVLKCGDLMGISCITLSCPPTYLAIMTGIAIHFKFKNYHFNIFQTNSSGLAPVMWKRRKR
jgi:hypothetical protein